MLSYTLDFGGRVSAASRREVLRRASHTGSEKRRCRFACVLSRVGMRVPLRGVRA